MNRRYTILLILAGLLLAANLSVWLPRLRAGHEEPSAAVTDRFEVEDFLIKDPLWLEEQQSATHRDLFWAAVPKKQVVRNKPIKLAKRPPSKTRAQLEIEAARKQMAQIKCVGVAFRGQKWQAFLVQGDQLYLANPGDTVANRFIVKKIEEESVVLMDKRTAISTAVPVSGADN